MFDAFPTEARFDLLERIRRFFLLHGTDLALAASLLGGTAGVRRVGSCTGRLETAGHIDHHIRRELRAIHRLLSLDAVGDPDNLETALFSDLNPGSAEVETICRLTDMLDDLLQEADAAADHQSRSQPTCASLAA
jgi:hypothetical protein